MVSVRVATADDVAEVVVLHAAVAEEGRWIGTEAPVDVERFTNLFRDSVESPEHLLLVGVEGERIVGHLGLHPIGHGVLGLGMAIDAAFRGQGVGAALMAAALSWARSLTGVHRVELEVWPHNAAGLALYRRFGFAVEGRRRRAYRRRSGELWDAVVMGLVLDGTSPGSPYPDAPELAARAQE